MINIQPLVRKSLKDRIDEKTDKHTPWLKGTAENWYSVTWKKENGRSLAEFIQNKGK